MSLILAIVLTLSMIHTISASATPDEKNISVSALDITADPEQSALGIVPFSAPLKEEIYKDTSGKYSFAERAADLVSRMTVSEKASQTVGSMSPAIPRLGLSGYQWWNETLHGFCATTHTST